jgi:hypothetical protein
MIGISTRETAPAGRRPASAARLILMVPLVAAAALTGCTTAPAPPSTPAAAVSAPAAAVPTAGLESVGRLSGTDALVAVVSDGDEVVAYVCDGPAALGERFFGILDGGRAVLRSDGGAELDLTVVDGTATGTFTAAGGIPVAFTTAPTTGDAGLYFADGIEDGRVYGAGWIVLADGTQTGTETRDRRSRRTAPKLDRDRLEKIRVTRPPTSSAAAQPTKPRPTAGERVPARVISRTDVALARLCSIDPARCPFNKN